MNLSAVVCCVLSLAGCVSTTPPTALHQPISVRPLQRPQAAPADGAIYQTGYGSGLLFEDRRARNVGGPPEDRFAAPWCGSLSFWCGRRSRLRTPLSFCMVLENRELVVSVSAA